MTRRLGSSPRSQRGFTLMEAVLVIMLTGIVAVMVGVFIRAPITGYVDQARRAELSDTADTALRRVAREVQRALPNSVRVGAAGAALEFLPVVEGGRYRAAPRADGSGNALDFDSGTDNSFDVLGPAVSVSAGQRLVIYNLTDSDAYAGTSSRVLTSNGSGLSTLAYTVGGTQFPFASPSHRFQVVGGPVTYLCTGTSLRRYSGYTMQAAQPTSAAAAPLSTAGSNALLANGVSACSFSYSAANTARNGLLTLRLQLSASGESITLVQQIHVDNSP